MARTLRIELPGAVYHVTSRGDRREAIFEDDDDRRRFLEILSDVVGDRGWLCHAWCLMINHYHLVVETPAPDLSRGMRQINGVFTQASNRRHRRVGHVFQGRYKAILVDAEAYLSELMRYVVLNPVRAGMVDGPGDWPWSSHGAMTGEAAAPPWFPVERLRARFAANPATAVGDYRRFVAEGIGREPIWSGLNRQVFLGDDRFVARALAERAGGASARPAAADIPKVQQHPPAEPLAVIAAREPDRDRAIVAAHASGAYSYQQIAAAFGLHFTTVGRIVRAAKATRRSMLKC